MVRCSLVGGLRKYILPWLLDLSVKVDKLYIWEVKHGNEFNATIIAVMRR